MLAGKNSSLPATTPIRVAFVMHKMQVAGAEVLVKQIIERLDGQIEPTVLCLDSVGELGYRLMDHGVPVVSLDRQPGFDASVARKLADELKSRKIQVIHAHQYTPFFYSALARIRHRSKVKILFTEHGRHYPDVVSWKRRTANRLLLRRYADVATACCDFSTKALRGIEGFPQAYTLANGVDLSELPQRGDHKDRARLRERLGLDTDRPYVACIARFHAVKDHPTLIRAWSKVHERLPDAQLLLVGDGEERESIESLIAELEARESGTQSESQSDGRSSIATSVMPLSSRITFLGIRSDVGDLLRAVDVFTLTSVSEAASLTLLEAMASGCPSVVTDVGGNGEHLRQGKDGFLVPRGDDKVLAEKLIALISDPEQAESMGRSSRQQVEQKFHLNDAVDKYHEIYQQLAN